VLLDRINGRDDGTAFPVPPPRPPREFRGVVLAGGAAAAGATITLYEDAEQGFRATGTVEPDGTFLLAWTPTATDDPALLYLAAQDREQRYARTIAPASPAGTRIELAAAVAVRGSLLDAAGRPRPGGTVHVAVRHGDAPAVAAVADDEGRFATAPVFPRGADLDLLARQAGSATRVEGRFAAGDEVTLHLLPGEDVEVRAVDPRGRPVPGAAAALHVPLTLRDAAGLAPADAEGRMRLPGASDGGVVFVRLQASGWLPVDVPAWPGPAQEVVLWPAREVEVVAWDAWNQRGVGDADFEVEIAPPDGEDWWGAEAGRVGRRWPARPGAGTGFYHLQLPACPLTLLVSAATHGDGSAKLGATEERAVVRLTPVRARGKPATLLLRAPPETPDLDLLVVDEEGDYLQRGRLRAGRADLNVPPGRRLQVASAGAADGIWVPRHTVDALDAGASRTVRLGTRPAVPVTVEVTPPVAAEVTLRDAEHRDLFPPQRAELVGGAAHFWARPFRRLEAEVTPPDAFFVHEGELKIEQQPYTWEVRLREAARLRLRVVDQAGHPLPFARVALWEPGGGGQMVLRAPPRVYAADAAGVVRCGGLRAGEAAVEISAPGFRAHRIGLVRLQRGEEQDAGAVALGPAGMLEGRVVDPEGNGVAGVQVRVLAPGIANLPLPGGGERELYDLTASATGDAITRADGTFRVPDPAPRHPLLALYPGASSEHAALPVEPAPVLTLRGTAWLSLDVPGRVEGVYLLLPPAKAVLVRTDPPMSLRPLPVVLPAGPSSLFVRLRDGRWAAADIDLAPGEDLTLTLTFER